MKIIALIVAGGMGTRLSSVVPKQYLAVGGRAILRRSVMNFMQNAAINDVFVVINEQHKHLYNACMQGISLPEPIFGGDSRQESVRLGLEAIAHLQPDFVLIHDAARPFTDQKLINSVIAGLKENDAVISAVPISDTLKRVDNMQVVETLDRSQVWRAQTPQAFRFEKILNAHKKFIHDELTDDSSLIEKIGDKVHIVRGSTSNFKITTEEDLTQARKLFQQPHSANDFEYRTGIGFDVHAFDNATGRDEIVHLCGVSIPYRCRLMGHSDADVAIHAIVDSLLGAIGAGDIGQHFPDKDERWKGAESSLFLSHTAIVLEHFDAEIVNIDVTIICQEPKISPYREQMRHSLACILGISVNKISVKATTTERLGFTGREEGIAAQAIATVKIPSQQ